MKNIVDISHAYRGRVNVIKVTTEDTNLDKSNAVYEYASLDKNFDLDTKAKRQDKIIVVPIKYNSYLKEYEYVMQKIYSPILDLEVFTFPYTMTDIQSVYEVTRLIKSTLHSTCDNIRCIIKNAIVDPEIIDMNISIYLCEIGTLTHIDNIIRIPRSKKEIFLQNNIARLGLMERIIFASEICNGE